MNLRNRLAYRLLRRCNVGGTDRYNYPAKYRFIKTFHDASDMARGYRPMWTKEDVTA